MDARDCHKTLVSRLHFLLISNTNQLIVIDYYWLLLILLIIDYHWMISPGYRSSHRTTCGIIQKWRGVFLWRFSPERRCIKRLQAKLKYVHYLKLRMFNREIGERPECRILSLVIDNQGHDSNATVSRFGLFLSSISAVSLCLVFTVI